MNRDITDLFPTLIRYHITRNLAAASPYLTKGQMHLSDEPVVVGEENGQQWYRGILLFANGEDLADRMQANGIIKQHRQLTYRAVSDEESLFEILDTAGKKDNAFIYDRKSKRITKQRLNNSAPSIDSIQPEDILPSDFLSDDSSVSMYDEDGWTNLGNRSDLAVKITQGGLPDMHDHPVDAYLIKHTIYNSTGLGTVVHMDKDSMQLFFFRYNPQQSERMINQEKSIVGIIREYRISNGTYVPIGMDREVYLNDEGVLLYRNNRQYVPAQTKQVRPAA